MKHCLVDVNVLLALVAQKHVHHNSARKWYAALAAGEAGLCRVVQLALIRLLNQPAVMGEDALPAAAAWRLIEELLQDERLEFVNEPAQIDSVLPALFVHRMPTGKLVMDAYLAAFAMAASRRLVTFDKGFEQFRGLELELLR
jgi:toxin-antitoxin system PIN domain toxin